MKIQQSEKRATTTKVDFWFETSQHFVKKASS